jgi:hypothetical protein
MATKLTGNRIRGNAVNRYFFDFLSINPTPAPLVNAIGLGTDVIFEFRHRTQEKWLGLFAQGSATDKWIACRLFPQSADMGCHAGSA